MVQTPQQEAQERIAESLPVYMLPRVIAAEDYRASQAAYRQRVDAAHAAGWVALGMGDALASKLNAKEEMGDIKIQGDTYQYFGDQALKTELPALQAPAPPVSGPLAKLAGPALLGAALLGTGGGGMALYNWLTQPTTPVVAPNEPTVPPLVVEPSEYKLGAEVKDRE